MEKEDVPSFVCQAFMRVIEQYDASYATVPVLITRKPEGIQFKHLEVSGDSDLMRYVEQLDIDCLDGTTEYAFCFPGEWESDDILTVDYCNVNEDTGRFYFCRIEKSGDTWSIKGEPWVHSASRNRYVKNYPIPETIFELRTNSGSTAGIEINYRVAFKFKPLKGIVAEKIVREDVNRFVGYVEYEEEIRTRFEVVVEDMDKYPISEVVFSYKGQIFRREKSIYAKETDSGTELVNEENDVWR